MSESKQLDNVAIEAIIPHRFPFLLVDKVLEMKPGKRITALKNVTINEQFFQGHFPGAPVMPGVLIVEALAQTAAILVMQDRDNWDKIPVFMSMDAVKFRNPVKPGDTLKLEAEIIRPGQVFAKFKCRAVISGTGKTAVDCEIMAGIVDKSKTN
jgi:3-hydroxyacyl-[acyl-carrier-protein] dehydratase